MLCGKGAAAHDRTIFSNRIFVMGSDPMSHYPKPNYGQAYFIGKINCLFEVTYIFLKQMNNVSIL